MVRFFKGEKPDDLLQEFFLTSRAASGPLWYQEADMPAAKTDEIG